MKLRSVLLLAKAGFCQAQIAQDRGFCLPIFLRSALLVEKSALKSPLSSLQLMADLAVAAACSPRSRAPHPASTRHASDCKRIA